MRPGIVWTIYRKELVDSLRDRLTLLVVVVLPILLYPMLIIGISKLVDTQVAEQEMRASKVAVWGEAPGLLEWLRQTNIFELQPGAGAPAQVRGELEAGTLQPVAPLAHTNTAASGLKKNLRLDVEVEPENPVLQAARSLVAGRDADAVLVVWPGFARSLETGALARVSIYFDSVRLGSVAAEQRLWTELGNFRKEQLQERERLRGLPEGFSKAVDILPRNVAPQSRRGGQFVGSILPFLLIVLSAVGALNAAIDLTAGEKDRNTMQTLLCAPVRPLEIVAGKFLAVWTISLVAALANTSSLAATFTRMASATGLSSVPLSTHFYTFCMLLPVTFIITAVFLAVAAMARDAKDAGNFLGPAMMVLLGPLGAGMTPGMELNAWTSFVPLLNVTLLIKSFYLAEARADLVFLTLVSSVMYAVLALVFAARVFGREQVLLGGKDSVRALFTVQRRRSALPTPAFALSCFVIIQVVTFYGSLWLRDAGLASSVLAVQYGFFLLPVVGLALLMRFSPVQTFSLRRPDWRGLLAALLMGASAWTLIGGLVIRLLPPPDSLVKALEKVLLLDSADTPLWAVWLVIGVSPALCEELLFRGLILSGLRRLGKWPAIGLSALLFAVAHSSIYRLLPTLVLGLLLGYLVWRTGSIYCGMLFHAVNNGLMATLVYHQATLQSMGARESTYLPWDLTLAGTAVLAVGLWVLRFARPPNAAEVGEPSG